MVAQGLPSVIPPRPQIDADPDYDLAASLGSRPALRGSPRPPPPTAAQIGAALEGSKEAVMAQYGLVSRPVEIGCV